MSKAELIIEKLLVVTSDDVKLRRLGFKKINSIKNSEEGFETYAKVGSAHHILYNPTRGPKQQYMSVSKTNGKTKKVSHPSMEAAVRRVTRVKKALELKAKQK